jgi:hypothetical protein
MVLLRQVAQAAMQRELSIAKLLSTLVEFRQCDGCQVPEGEYEMLKILGASALLLVSMRRKDE